MLSFMMLTRELPENAPIQLTGGVCRHSLGSSLLKVTVHPNIKNSVGVYSPSCDGKSAEAS